MIIAGRKCVIEYMNSKMIDGGAKIFIAENISGKIIADISDKAVKKNIPIIKISKDEIDKKFSGNNQGVILEIHNKEKKQVLDIDSILKSGVENKQVVVALDQITDPHNVGSIIRTAEALGAICVVMTKDNSPEINETVIKTSAGATAHIPITKITNLAAFIEKCKEYGYWVIGSSDKGTKSISDIKNIKPVLLIIGSEGDGMRRLTEEKCDYVVSIPMRGKVSSLNASVSTGILLYELINN